MYAIAHDVKVSVLISAHVDIQVNATLHVSHSLNNVLVGCAEIVQLGSTLSTQTAKYVVFAVGITDTHHEVCAHPVLDLAHLHA